VERLTKEGDGTNATQEPRRSGVRGRGSRSQPPPHLASIFPDRRSGSGGGGRVVSEEWEGFGRDGFRSRRYHPSPTSERI
jgi:hypothetical protein